jgi:hypothetical protein
LKTVTVVAGLFASVVLAHSAQLFAQAAQAPVPEAAQTGASGALPGAAPAATEASAPVPEAAKAPPDTTDDHATDDHAEPEAEAAPSDEKHDVGMGRLELDLHKVQTEREKYSRFWPWFTVGAGAAMTLGGTAVGASKVFGCDGGCSTSAWIGIIVATGTFVATVGTIWVVRANADVREIDSHRYQLEQEIERIRISSKLPNRFDNQGSSPQFSMRFALN